MDACCSFLTSYRHHCIKKTTCLQVIELIGKENVQLNSKQLDEILQLLEKEEVLELEDQIQKALEKASTDKMISHVTKGNWIHSLVMSLIVTVFQIRKIRV